MLTAYRQAPYLIEHAPGMGSIARYHLDSAQVDARLALLRAAGADGISLSLWLRKNAVALGLADTYLEWSGGQLAPLMLQNLVGVLASIKRHGFNFVQLAPQFYAENDFRKWG